MLVIPAGGTSTSWIWWKPGLPSFAPPARAVAWTSTSIFVPSGAVSVPIRACTAASIAAAFDGGQGEPSAIVPQNSMRVVTTIGTPGTLVPSRSTATWSPE